MCHMKLILIRAVPSWCGEFLGKSLGLKVGRGQKSKIIFNSGFCPRKLCVTL